MNHELIQTKLNTHSDSISNNETKKLDSIKVCFDTKHDFNLFRYYLNDYLNSRINIQYFLFLITNRIVKSFKKLIDSEQLHGLIKVNDVEVLDKFLQTRQELLKVEVDDKLNDESASYVYLMCENYKKRLATRSTENLEIMSDPESAQGGLHDKPFYKSLDNLVEIV